MNHKWGEDFDWDALNEACSYLEKNCRRWARMGIWTKEKYGTMRVSTTCAWFGMEPFQNVFYPGYVRAMFPRWFRKYIDLPLGTLLSKLRITRFIQWYQYSVLKYFWKKAAKKWPHIAEEILDEYEWTVGEHR